MQYHAKSEDISADITVPEVNINTLGVLDFVQQKDIFAIESRKAWDKTEEARCDFSYHLRVTRRSDVNFISIWQKSVFGQTLTEIKSNDDNVQFFADSITPVIMETIGYSLADGDWCIVTTPKRRHLTKNFATRISEKIAQLLNIPFYEDVAHCRTKQRVNAIFDINILPKENNIIVFDDFVTTGQTLLAMKNLLRQYNKNLVFFTGINNKI